jgi:3'(2'), 5'-bisphosphate nucleotidase
VDYAIERKVVIDAIKEAARLCATVRAEMVDLESLEKGDKSPVTIADWGAQALICRKLRGAFPADPIVAEEDSASLTRPENALQLERVTQYVRRLEAEVSPQQVCRWIDAGNGRVARRFWTLDPIDGTKGFLRNDQYAIALALVEDGQVQVGALACPSLPLEMGLSQSPPGVLFVAVRGAGAAMAPLDNDAWAPIHVGRERLRFVESVEAAHGNPALQKAVARTVGIKQPPLKMDSQAKYGAVARGDAALYLRLPSSPHGDYREKIWDHAAGTLIVEEAGGRVTDMHGRPLDLASGYRMTHNHGVVASNGAVHDAALKALAQHRV